MRTAAATQRGPLAGVRVLDITRVLAGPFCTMNLGDMGADIIKLETPGQGDDTRHWGPPFVGNQAAYFLGVNRNKRSLTLNMKSSDGVAIFKKLVTTCDVLIENLKLGTLESWGLDAVWFETNTPTLIRCNISGYGTTGPRAGQPGYDVILQAECGLMSITGDTDGAAMKFGVPIVDLCTGLYATNGIVAALHSRRETGQGQRVEVSLHDTGLALLSNVASNYLATGEDAPRLGNGHPNCAPYNVYPTRDGEIVVTIGNDAAFERFARVLDQEAWLSDKRFIRNADRVTHRSQIDAAVTKVLGSADSRHWLKKFRQANIASAEVASVAEALTSEHSSARQMTETISDDQGQTLRLTGIPIKFSHTPAGINQAPPALGAHTREILEHELGIEVDAIERLHAAGVI